MGQDKANKRIEELRAELERIRNEAAEEKKTLLSKTQKLVTLFAVSTRLQEVLSLEDELNTIASGISQARLYRRAIISLFDEDWNRINFGYTGLTSKEIEQHKSSKKINKAMWKRIFSSKYKISRSYYIPHDSDLSDEIQGLPSKRKADQFQGWDPQDLLFTPLKNKNGKILGVLSVDDPHDGLRPTENSLQILELFAKEAASIIERNELYNNLAQAENYFKKLVQTSGDIIFSSDYNDRVVVFNKGAEDILGYKYEDVKNKSIIGFFSNENDARVILDNLNQDGNIRGYETKLNTVKGEEIPVSLTATLLYDEDENVIGAEWISKDLRELKGLQEKVIEMERKIVVQKVVIGLAHRVNNYLQEILILEKTLEDLFSTCELREGDDTISSEINNSLNELRSSVLKIKEITNQLKEPTNKLEEVNYIGDLPMISIPEVSVERAFDTPARSKIECSGKQVLVADDDSIVRDGIAKYLFKKGFCVDTAKDGREAIKKINMNEYEIVVSDIKMPHKSGYDVFDAAKDKNAETCVVLITAFGYDPNHAIVKAVKRGLKGIFLKEKPLECERLYDIIERNLRKD
ncbi:response regulator [bacterium]|nr:response regulator [bacterium]